MPSHKSCGAQANPKKHREVALSVPATGDEEWQALRAPIESGWLTQGPRVAEFEKGFSARHGVAHAIATTSGTTALHLALAALGIGPGDEVIVPAFTWVATANVVLYTGATPIFVDVRSDTYNLDIDAVAQLVTKRTRAVIAVHLFGLCADIDALKRILPDNVSIIEDAACAAGSAYKGKAPGGLGTLGCFSFHPRKSITTGEGGMLTTNDPVLAERAAALRSHGATLSDEARRHGPAPHRMPDINMLGFNYRMSDLQAAVGVVQLTKLDEFIDERNHWAKWYHDKLADLRWLKLPHVPENSRHAWQAFVTIVDETISPLPRNAIMEMLQKRGIGTRPGTHAVTDLGYYRDTHGIQAGEYPVASYLDQCSMAIPLHNRMSDADYQHVAQALHDL